MEKQTENYIVLKPIAERFNKIAVTISDEDIRRIIKQAMADQIKGIFDFSRLDELTETWIEENEEKIKEMISKSISDKLNNKK